MSDPQKIQVTERALLTRLNRHLAKEARVLKKCRADSPQYGDLGDFYEVNTEVNGITAKRVDVERLARELGILRAFEELSQEDPPDPLPDSVQAERTRIIRALAQGGRRPPVIAELMQIDQAEVESVIAQGQVTP